MMASVTVLLVAALSLLLPRAWAFCEQSSVEVGFLFNCQIDWGDFYDEEPPPADVGVQYSVSLNVSAGLPKWLTLLQSKQQSSSSPAYLYGTPLEEDLGQTILRASLTRLDTLEKKYKEMRIVVQQPQGKILQSLEFYITNYTIEDFLSSNVISRFTQTLLTVYQQEATAVTKVISPLERGILVPPPPDKHGVIVQATPGLNVAVTTNDEPNSVQENCDTSQSFNPPPLNFELFARNGFNISWCHYIMTSLSFDNQQQLSSRPVESNSSPDQEQPRPDGSKVSLVVVMALGFVIIIMAVSGLALVFFGRRKSSVSRRQRRRRDTMKHHIEEDVRGPSTAQKHLRDLSLSHTVNMRSGDAQAERVGYGGEEGGLLEFQDVVDYGNGREVASSIRDEETPPPPEYTYEEDLLSRSLYEPGKRSRLITI